MTIKMRGPVSDLPPAELTEKLEHSILGDTPLEFGETGSSLVESAQYNPDQQVAVISLKAGKVIKSYTYAGFLPSLWVEFYQAESKGGFFNRVIRPMLSGSPVDTESRR